MNRNLLLYSLGILFLFTQCSPTPEQESLSIVIDRGFQRATEQALLMAKELENREGELPRSTHPDGSLSTSDYEWWCSGFFPGQLWYLYENHPTTELKKYAELYTGRVENVKHLTNTHDIGFMLYCSYGNGYRITQNPDYVEVLTTGANSLITRYDPAIGAIRSWDWNKEVWQYAVIIDNMMNLELLTWTSRITGDETYEQIAHTHALKTLEHHYRPDYSCYHVISYDTISGLPHAKQTHQGYADESAWARGQAWGLYGYTMMFRETHNPVYLEQARQIAGFLLHHPNMPEDKVPYWDFDDPDIPNVPRDASAAAIMASALIELSQLDPSGKEYLAFAEQQIRSLSSPAYLAEKGENNYFTIMHCTGHLPGNSEVDVPLSYADYYYVEALLRMKELRSRSE
ncbi:MAG: glycoside hydrolase family 88 protein [Tannerellaceae bacterium]|nr:glycoside hydrolase family 88 protein [Tannerellaceae bacterium]